MASTLTEKIELFEAAKGFYVTITYKRDDGSRTLTGRVMGVVADPQTKDPDGVSIWYDSPGGEIELLDIPISSIHNVLIHIG